MFNLSPYAYELQAQEREERLQQAEYERLAERIKHSQPSTSFSRRQLASFGKLLVAVGQSMQDQTAEATAINTISRPIV